MKNYQIKTIGEVPPQLIDSGLLIRVWHSWWISRCSSSNMIPAGTRRPVSPLDPAKRTRNEHMNMRNSWKQTIPGCFFFEVNPCFQPMGQHHGFHHLFTVRSSNPIAAPPWRQHVAVAWLPSGIFSQCANLKLAIEIVEIPMKKMVTGGWFGCHLDYFPRNIGLLSSSQLTHTYFSEGWPNHQPDGDFP